MKYKTALVTGGAGFIGSHLVDALIKRRVKVYVVDDLSTGVKSNLNPNASLLALSVASPRLPGLIKKIKPDVIFHLAAQIDVRASVEDPVADAETNIVGTVNLLHAAVNNKVKKFIMTSTGGAMFCDDVRPPYSEATPPAPISPYGLAKRAAESYVEYACITHGLSTVILRPANVFGPRQGLRGEAGVIALFARRMTKGQQVVINGDGKNTRDYIYVDDLVQAQLLAMDKSVSGVFHIGNGQEVNVNAIFQKLNRLIGGKMKEVHGPAKLGEVRRSALDARRARRVLGWRPGVSLDEGLRRTVEWFRAQGK